MRFGCASVFTMNFIRGPHMHPDIGTLQCSVCGPEFEVALPVTSKNQKKAENILDHIRSHTTLIAIQTQCCGEFLVPAIKQTYFQPRCPHVNTVQVLVGGNVQEEIGIERDQALVGPFVGEGGGANQLPEDFPTFH
ncbi:hypothetical protein RvY_07793-1 [Ramazzottius varieornatus]|uniref:Uncharacterized protein n=2 Tax=Ramazzottius varieornatus TaxID=947166 RepID=A0A1D1V8G7_RAMVA|nr:hypothetical protein RvY_07793-1 [Ramazzottius varieornatus]